MKKTLTTRVGADGVLTVALGEAEANKEVRVTVEPLAPSDRAAWLRFLERTGGSISDPTFERPPQGEYEVRDPLP